MTVKEIVKKYLEDNGFDGLCGEECGCVVGDLSPCGSFSDECEPGYNQPRRAEHEGCQSWIGPEKEEEE